MILRNADYRELSKRIVEEKKRIIVYGAGMIGRIVVPYLVKEYNLMEYLDCFIDADKRKHGHSVRIGKTDYPITDPRYLETINENSIVLISNSNFYPVIKDLDEITNLNNVEGYIIPIMQVQELEFAEQIEILRESDNQLIPKKIHYCWFGGGKKPDFLETCISSWRKNCPGYDIVEWNEDNYDVYRHHYTKEAYARKRYGFVSDLARLDVLYENGGLYFDTDVTIVKNIDDLLFQEAFVGVEKWGNINTGGGCGFIKGHPMLKEMIDYRDAFHFELDDGSINVETNGMYETEPFLNKGFKPCNVLQKVGGVTIYPAYVTHPYDYMSCKIQKMDATISVHHFWGGWMEMDERKNRDNTQKKYAEVLKRFEILAPIGR